MSEYTGYVYEGTTTKAIPASEYEHYGKFIKDEEEKPSLMGWVCPVCGRGLSPYTSVCPCKGFIEGEWKVTC